MEPVYTELFRFQCWRRFALILCVSAVAMIFMLYQFQLDNMQIFNWNMPQPNNATITGRTVTAGLPEANRRLVIYNKPMKTGSTSFKNVLIEISRPNGFQFRKYGWDFCQDPLKQDFHLINAAANQRVVFLCEDCPFHQWPHKPVYISMIRDPLQRLVSYYYSRLNGDSIGGPRDPKQTRKRCSSDYGRMFPVDDPLADPNLSLDELIRRNGSFVRKMLWNQIPLFCGRLPECRVQASRWALDRAKLVLEREYLVVGITERFEEFWEVLEMLVPAYFRGAAAIARGQERLRTTLNRKELSRDSAEVIGTMEEFRLEKEFYEFVAGRFEQILHRYVVRVH